MMIKPPDNTKFSLDESHSTESRWKTIYLAVVGSNILIVLLLALFSHQYAV